MRFLLYRKMRVIALSIYLSVSASYHLHSQKLAFPTAEGFGRFTTGGRGGSVIEVTNLNDSGTGSLRAAVQASGTRTIIFRVSGTIALQSDLIIKNGNVTIAGQTAPGDGICIKNYQLTIKADNVIIRYLRIRTGNEVQTGEYDAAWGRNQKNIILDHCSFSWANDELASFYDNTDFTMQWCMISESFYHSTHPKGDHGYGGIWGGMGASFHHNLVAHNTSRNPRFCGARYHVDSYNTELVDFRNNVIYNWGSNSAYGGEGGKCNMVNNYYKPGPATKSSKVSYRIVNPSKDATVCTSEGTLINSQWYIAGNYMYNNATVTADNWNGGVQPDEGAPYVKATVPFDVAPVKTETPENAFISVLSKAGANLPKRDTVDGRVVYEAKKGIVYFGGTYGANKGIIDDQVTVGGYPVLNSGTAPADTDGDGMPDAWETSMGLNPSDGIDGKSDRNNDGYTNLEDYLNVLSGDTVFTSPNPGTGISKIPGIDDGLTIYPNPVIEYATIAFDLESASFVSISITDVTGRLQTTIFRDMCTVGHHEINWDRIDNNPKQLKSGTYICVVETKNGKMSRKLILDARR